MIKVCKRPRRGDIIDTRFGPATVTRVRAYGERLEVHSATHGDEHIERHPDGHWTVVGIVNEDA